MAYIKISKIIQELTERGYQVEDKPVQGSMGCKFIAFDSGEEQFCIGPFEGKDKDQDIIVDSGNLWICHREDLENNVFKNDKSLPDTEYAFVIVNCAEAWVMRDSLFPHAIPL